MIQNASRVMVLVILVWHFYLYAGTLGSSDNLDKVYRNESHCLVGSEIRGEQDNPISCYCRDAIMDARYVYENYLHAGKDRNLNGAYLRLCDYALQMCGEQYDVLKATQKKDWQWNGPQVTREYPPERKIDQIQPDSEGFRTVLYMVHLTYRDQRGHVTKVENFTTMERLPPNLKE